MFADPELLNTARHGREHVVGIRSDQPNRAHDDNQNHGQHDRVFRNILSLLISQQLLKKLTHPSTSQIDIEAQTDGGTTFLTAHLGAHALARHFLVF